MLKKLSSTPTLPRRLRHPPTRSLPRQTLALWPRPLPSFVLALKQSSTYPRGTESTSRRAPGWAG